MIRPDVADHPYHFMALTGFPYIIIYNSQRVPPRILRILHEAQDIPEILRKP